MDDASIMAGIPGSSVAVITYPDTPLIEAMVLGVPVIGIWNTELWEMRSDAAPHFEELAELGIIYSDPRAAAAKLDDVYARADRWWAEPAIQAARRRFLERFATPGDWRRDWVQALRDLTR